MKSAQDAGESWTDEERHASAAHIEEGYLQAERRELIDGERVRREIQTMIERGLAVVETVSASVLRSL